MIRNLAIAVGLGAFLLAGTAHAAVDPAIACKEKKAKATGKKAADVLKAFGKNDKKPDAIRLVADISKAQSKYTKAFDKAESGGSCQTTGDSGSIEAKVDAFVLETIGSIDPICGDDIKAPTEECDGTDDAACPGACQPPGPAGHCGDNTVNAPTACTCPVEECDGADDSACPGLCKVNCTCGPGCGNGVVEGSEQCDPPGEQNGCAGGEVCNGLCQCEPVAACACGTPDPTQLQFTNKPATGNCGTTENATGSTVLDLACGALYIGGGGGALPLPVIIVDNLSWRHDVDHCNGTSITLGHTTAAETGDRRTCTAASRFTCSDDSSVPGAACFIDKDCHRCSETTTTKCVKDAQCPATETCDLSGSCDLCYFAAGPQPVVNQGNLFISSCLYNLVTRNSTGAIDCSTGEALINYQIDSNVVLPGTDQSPEHGWQSCPICVGGTIGAPGSGLCQGGPNNGLGCEPGNTQTDVHSCCIDDFLKNGKVCTDDSDCGTGTCVNDCSALRTSHDCPPNPLNNLGAIPVPFQFSTGSRERTANANGTFCGFCRDVDIEGSLCFEGDKDFGGAKDCPDSATIACKPASGTDYSECGNGVPCLVDSDCTAPYETCEQRNPGAWREASITYVATSGSPAGDLTDHLAHDATISDAFCIDSSFAPSIDQDSDLPGPGALTLYGEHQLLP